MQFIYSDSITSVSSSVGQLSTDYSISSVLNDIPKQPYISNSKNLTITISCAGAEALYFQALAEDITITQKNSSNQTISTTSVDNTNKFSTDYAYFYENRGHIFPAYFGLLDSSVSTVQLTISNSTDFSGSITNWVTGDAASMGYFTDGSTAQLTQNNPQLKLGTFINHAGGTSQINKIMGSGVGSQDFKLTTAGGSNFVVTSINLPVYINTIRAGKVLTVKNPKVGFSTTPQSFDIIQEKYTGLVRRAQETRRQFSGSFSVLEADREAFIRFQEGIRTKPIAVHFIGDLEDMALFGYFPQPPSFIYQYQGLQLFDVSFNFNELI